MRKCAAAACREPQTSYVHTAVLLTKHERVAVSIGRAATLSKHATGRTYVAVPVSDQAGDGH